MRKQEFAAVAETETSTGKSQFGVGKSDSGQLAHPAFTDQKRRHCGEERSERMSQRGGEVQPVTASPERRPRGSAAGKDNGSARNDFAVRSFHARNGIALRQNPVDAAFVPHGSAEREESGGEGVQNIAGAFRFRKIME